MTRHLTASAIGLVLVIVLGFVIWRIVVLSGQATNVPTIRNPGMLVPGVLLYVAALTGFGLLWRSVICRIDDRSPPVIDSLAVFWASWLGRYVPSSLPYLAGKFALGIRLGHGRTALAASMIYENALLCAVGAVLAAIAIPVALSNESTHPLVFVAAGLAGLAGLGVLSPPVFQFLVNGGLKLARRGPMSTRAVLPYGGILIASLIAGASLALNGAGFTFVVMSFVELSEREMIATAGILVLSGVVGLVVLPIPSGIGVREAVQIGLLQVLVPLEIAVAAAIITRLLMVGVDVGLGLIGGGLLAIRRPAPVVSTRIPPERQLDAAA